MHHILLNNVNVYIHVVNYNCIHKLIQFRSIPFNFKYNVLCSYNGILKGLIIIFVKWWNLSYCYYYYHYYYYYYYYHYCSVCVYNCSLQHGYTRWHCWVKYDACVIYYYMYLESHHNWFNPATCMCLSRNRTWISYVIICHSLFSVPHLS
jgi:hypothetical protein